MILFLLKTYERMQSYVMNNNNRTLTLEKWKLIIAMIKANDTIILHRHVLPDGDAIGSQLALKQLINLNFPKKKVYVVGAMVEYLTFLGTMDTIDNNDIYQNALVIVTDTANISRIDDQRYYLGKMIIKIDHHPNNDKYGDYQWVDTSYPATCEMIADFMFAMNLISDQFIAKCLLIGIITDTTRFMLRQISSRTFFLTSKLLEQYKESITTIYEKLDAKTTNEIEFLKYCYNNYQISPQGIINLIISNNHLNKLGISADKAAFHVNIFNNIINHPIWVVAIEYPDQHIRCELRTSDNNIKVNIVAQQFGGGGHGSAAGCKVWNLNDFNKLITTLETLL